MYLSIVFWLCLASIVILSGLFFSAQILDKVSSYGMYQEFLSPAEALRQFSKELPRKRIAGVLLILICITIGITLYQDAEDLKHQQQMLQSLPAPTHKDRGETEKLHEKKAEDPFEYKEFREDLM